MRIVRESHPFGNNKENDTVWRVGPHSRKANNTGEIKLKMELSRFAIPSAV